MWPEDKPVAPPEFQGMPGKENPELAEVYIPDYVMLDSGTPETTRADG
jgi:hypothetical protein